MDVDTMGMIVDYVANYYRLVRREMTEYSFENELISDLHKDARNHRPTSGFYGNVERLTDDQKQECWDNLISEMKYSGTGDCF